MYEIVFYDGDGWLPAYYVIDTIEVEKTKKAFGEKLKTITERVKEKFCIGAEVSSSTIQENLFMLNEDGLVPLSRGFMEPLVPTE